MLKYILLATVALAVPSYAECNPATGNWVNAAKTTCRVASYQDTTSSGPAGPVYVAPVKKTPPPPPPVA